MIDEILTRIRQDVAVLPTAEDTLVLDKALGQLMLLIDDARSLIDDEWRDARALLVTQPRKEQPARRTTKTIDDLLLGV